MEHFCCKKKRYFISKYNGLHIWDTQTPPCNYLNYWYWHSIHRSNPACISLKGCQGQSMSLTMSWCPDRDRYSTVSSSHTGQTSFQTQECSRTGDMEATVCLELCSSPFLPSDWTLRASHRGRCGEKEKDRGWDSWAPAAVTDLTCSCVHSHFWNLYARKTDASVQILVLADLKRGSLSAYLLVKNLRVRNNRHTGRSPGMGMGQEVLRAASIAASWEPPAMSLWL